jgi:hypothetical protein
MSHVGHGVRDVTRDAGTTAGAAGVPNEEQRA